MQQDIKNLSIKAVQECLALSPVIILGSGHSAAFGIPSVAQLADYLTTHVRQAVSTQDLAKWNELEGSLKTTDLEKALQGIDLSTNLTDLLIAKTWECIQPADRSLLDSIIQSTVDLPLKTLYEYLFRSTQKRISIITTNYDCLAEYAADMAGYAWTTKFGHGYIGHRYANEQISILKNTMPFRMVDIWKVHGSIDWYRNPDGILYCLPSVSSIPNGFSPVIVTPGIDKYRRTHEEPFRTVITGADSAIDAGNSFLCIGYGFNDEHIQPKLLEKCKRYGKKIVVLTKTLTEPARKFLLKGGCKNFIAFEESSKGTKIYSHDCVDGTVVEDVNFWSIGALLKEAL